MQAQAAQQHRPLSRVESEGVWVLAGGKVKSAKQPYQRRSRHATKGDEARDILANVVLCHVPVTRFNFQAKVCWLCRVPVMCFTFCARTSLLCHVPFMGFDSHAKLKLPQAYPLCPGLVLLAC